QVDMIKPAAATLGRDVLAEVERGVELLRTIARTRDDDALRRFKNAFVERYERREVPLMLALDEELGIGFDSASTVREHAPLLDDIAITRRPRDATVPWSARDTLLLEKLHEALASGAHSIALSRDDIEALASSRPQPLPDAFSVLGTVLARSNEA